MCFISLILNNKICTWDFVIWLWYVFVHCTASFNFSYWWYYCNPEKKLLPCFLVELVGSSLRNIWGCHSSWKNSNWQIIFTHWLCFQSLGDEIMADKGFQIQDILAPPGFHLNMPPFLSSNTQMSAHDVILTTLKNICRIYAKDQ